MLKHPAARLLDPLLVGASLAAYLDAHAQTTASQPVKWELAGRARRPADRLVLRTTNVGQARTDTHHNVVKNNVGCADKPAGDIDLQRTLTVSPIHASADDITLAIDAQETLAGRRTSRDDRAGLQAAAAAARRERVASGPRAQARRMVELADRRQESVAGVSGARQPEYHDGGAMTA